jgi:hypothetical protein
MSARRPILISERKAAKFLGMSCKDLKRLQAELPWFQCKKGVFYFRSRLEDYKTAQQ